MIYLLKDFDDTDFETGLGMWTNDYRGKLRWQRHSGYTQTMNTGPDNDHTKGNGKQFVMNLKIKAFTGKYEYLVINVTTSTLSVLPLNTESKTLNEALLF